MIHNLICGYNFLFFNGFQGISFLCILPHFINVFFPLSAPLRLSFYASLTNEKVQLITEDHPKPKVSVPWELFETHWDITSGKRVPHENYISAPCDLTDIY